MDEILSLEARIDKLAKQLLFAKDAVMIEIINNKLDELNEEIKSLKFDESDFNEFVEHY